MKPVIFYTTGKQITWGEDGEPSKEPTVVVIENGAYSVL